MAEIWALDGLGLADLIRRKEVSATEVMEQFLARANALNPRLNAVTELYAERALAEAASGPVDGPFHGVPFLVKQLVASIGGEPTTAGSRLTGRRPAPQDSFAMVKARGAGLIIAGRTTTSEFGLSPDTTTHLYGQTRNPWDLTRSPGGSSGGAAAAVAAGLLPLAHATDGGGSIRIPAAACGLVGLKPSRARISAGPEVGEGLAGFSVQGVVSRTMRDTAAYLDAVSGPMPGDPYAAPPFAESCLAATAPARRRPLRIAFSAASPLGTMVEPELRAAVLAMAELFRSLGHQVEEAAPEFDAEIMAEGFLSVFSANCAATLTRITGCDALPEAGIEPLTRAIAAHGRGLSVAQYINHQQALQREARRLMGFYERFDLWLTPCLGHLPRPVPQFDVESSDIRAWLGALFAFSPFAWLCNITGQPALALPAGMSAAGLPIGIHLAARAGEEPLLCRIGAEIERVAPWAARRPDLTA